MSNLSRVAAIAVTVCLCAQAALAHDGVHVTDAYARVSAPGAASGAAFMVIGNSGATEDRLIDARSDIAERVELHTHAEDGDGVMRMIHVEEGFAIPAAGEVVLERGGRHVMFLGLRRDLEQGDTVPLTLVFENEGEVSMDITVDNQRRPGDGSHDHGHHHGHGHGN